MTNNNYDIDYNYSISVSDLVLLDDYDFGDPACEVKCLRDVGFDIAKGYELVGPIEHRNLQNQIVTCCLYRGFLDEQFAKENGIKNAAEVIMGEPDKDMRGELKKMAGGY